MDSNSASLSLHRIFMVFGILRMLNAMVLTNWKTCLYSSFIRWGPVRHGAGWGVSGRVGRRVGVGGRLPHQTASVALLPDGPRGDGAGSGPGRDLPHYHKEDLAVAALSTQVIHQESCLGICVCCTVLFFFSFCGGPRGHLPWHYQKEHFLGVARCQAGYQDINSCVHALLLWFPSSL